MGEAAALGALDGGGGTGFGVGGALTLPAACLGFEAPFFESALGAFEVAAFFIRIFGH